MAKVSCTPALVAPVMNTQPEIITIVANAAVERGDVLAVDGTSGKAVPCEAACGAALGVVGIALNKVGAGQVVSVLINRRGTACRAPTGIPFLLCAFVSLCEKSGPTPDTFPSGVNVNLGVARHIQ